MKIGIIRNPVALWVLSKIFNLIPRLPYCYLGVLTMAWILRHTPDDEEER